MGNDSDLFLSEHGCQPVDSGHVRLQVPSLGLSKRPLRDKGIFGYDEGREFWKLAVQTICTFLERVEHVVEGVCARWGGERWANLQVLKRLDID